MIETDVDWIPFEFLRWISSCEGMPGPIEFVYWRLTLHAYKSGVGFVEGSPLRLAAKCKVDKEAYLEAVEYLAEDKKIVVMDSGIAVPSAQKRLVEARDRIEENRNKTAKAREIAQIKRDENCSINEARDIYAQRHAANGSVTDEKPASTEPVTGDLLDKESTDIQTDRQKKEIHIWQVGADDAALVWNNAASRHGLAKVAKLTESRLTHLRKRLKDHNGFQGMHGLDLWTFACSQIQHSQFLLGKKPNSDWRANFDSMVRPDNFAKLIEGGYSDQITPDHQPDNGGGQLQRFLDDWQN